MYVTQAEEFNPNLATLCCENIAGYQQMTDFIEYEVDSKAMKKKLCKKFIVYKRKNLEQCENNIKSFFNKKNLLDIFSY